MHPAPLLRHNAILCAREALEEVLRRNGYADDDLIMDDHAQEWRAGCEKVLYELCDKVDQHYAESAS